MNKQKNVLLLIFIVNIAIAEVLRTGVPLYTSGAISPAITYSKPSNNDRAPMTELVQECMKSVCLIGVKQYGVEYVASGTGVLICEDPPLVLSARHVVGWTGWHAFDNSASIPIKVLFGYYNASSTLVGEMKRGKFSSTHNWQEVKTIHPYDAHKYVGKVDNCADWMILELKQPVDYPYKAADVKWDWIGKNVEPDLGGFALHHPNKNALQISHATLYDPAIRPREKDESSAFSLIPWWNNNNGLPIEPGSSGGPLFNSGGQVVGILIIKADTRFNTSIADWVIPVNSAYWGSYRLRSALPSSLTVSKVTTKCPVPDANKSLLIAGGIPSKSNGSFFGADIPNSVPVEVRNSHLGCYWFANRSNMNVTIPLDSYEPLEKGIYSINLVLRVSAYCDQYAIGCLTNHCGGLTGTGEKVSICDAIAEPNNIFGPILYAHIIDGSLVDMKSAGFVDGKAIVEAMGGNCGGSSTCIEQSDFVEVKTTKTVPIYSPSTASISLYTGQLVKNLSMFDVSTIAVSVWDVWVERISDLPADDIYIPPSQGPQSGIEFVFPGYWIEEPKYSVDIDWGDGKHEKHPTILEFQELRHYYANPGEYTIIISTWGHPEDVLFKKAFSVSLDCNRMAKFTPNGVRFVLPKNALNRQTCRLYWGDGVTEVIYDKGPGDEISPFHWYLRDGTYTAKLNYLKTAISDLTTSPLTGTSGSQDNNASGEAYDVITIKCPDDKASTKHHNQRNK